MFSSKGKFYKTWNKLQANKQVNEVGLSPAALGALYRERGELKRELIRLAKP